MVTDASQVAQGGARDESISVTDAVLGSTPAVNDGRLLGHLTVYKEEELVLPDGATKGETVGGHLVLLTRLRNLITVYSVTAHVLVAVEDVGAAAEGVGTALGDGVHATTDEVGLTHVVGRNHNLHFLDCLDRNGVATTGQTVAQTEVVIEVGTVNGEVGQTAVGTGKAHAVTTVG